MNKINDGAMNQSLLENIYLSDPPPEIICTNDLPVSDDVMSPPVQMPIAPQHQLFMPVVVKQLVVGPDPVKGTCPHCHQHIETIITKETQKSAHIACVVLCLLGCCLLCSCLPYCMSSFQDVHHKCPLCDGFIGTYKR